MEALPFLLASPPSGETTIRGIPWRHILQVSSVTRVMSQPRLHNHVFRIKIPVRCWRGKTVALTTRQPGIRTQKCAPSSRLLLGDQRVAITKKGLTEGIYSSCGFILIILVMAVTQAGCDLTYCKMRGIVSVLTGTSQLNLSSSGVYNGFRSFAMFLRKQHQIFKKMQWEK